MADELNTALNDTLLTTNDKVTYLSDKIKPVFSKVIVALIVLLIGFIIGKLFGRIMQRVLSEIELNNIIKKSSGIQVRLEEFLSKACTYFIYFITIVMVLDILELTPIILYIVSGGIILIIVLSAFLAMKDFVPNMVAGIMIYRRKFFKQGDKVEIDHVKGKIEDITITNVIIETSKGDKIYIPNSLFTKKQVKKLKN